MTSNFKYMLLDCADTISHYTIGMWSRLLSHSESEYVSNKIRWSHHQKILYNKLYMTQNRFIDMYNKQFTGHSFKVGRSKK